MLTIDKRHWKKVERLSDKMAYVLEAVIRLKPELQATIMAVGESSLSSGVALEILQILWDVAEHEDVKEAHELFKNIASIRTDRALSGKRGADDFGPEDFNE